MVISDYIKIIRPANAFMVFAMVMAGIWFSDPQFIWWKYLLAAVVPISYTGIAMIHNDIIDLDIDIINAPDRPIPSTRNFVYLLLRNKFPHKNFVKMILLREGLLRCQIQTHK